jgi:CRISPR/Cas system-associated protein Csm6
VPPGDVPGYAWILFITESMGLAERLGAESFKLAGERARYLAEYIRGLASLGEC